MGRFDAVFFDLDRTLWDSAACSECAMEVVLPRLLEELPEERPAEVLVRFNAALLGLTRRLGIHGAGMAATVDRFRELLRSYGVQDEGLARQVSGIYSTARRFRMRSFLRDGVRRVLAGLRRRGITTGVITNGTPAIQRNVLQALGLEAYMDHVVIGEVEGFSKPDPRLFRRALALAGVEPHRALYVGDNPVTDVLGASRAGIAAALLRADGSEYPMSGFGRLPQPDYVIHELSELIPIVDGKG